MTDFWKNINTMLDDIEQAKPREAEELVKILKMNQTRSGEIVDGDAFFEGSGGNRQLLETMDAIGWEPVEVYAEYHWIYRHPRTNDHITYIEGDVYIGNHLED